VKPQVIAKVEVVLSRLLRPVLRGCHACSVTPTDRQGERVNEDDMNLCIEPRPDGKADIF
jgi:hypothetical protein